MGWLDAVGGALNTIWSVGGQLRKIYNDSTDEKQRAADHRATVIRCWLFTAWFLAVMVREKRELLGVAEKLDAFSAFASKATEGITLGAAADVVANAEPSPI